MSDLGYKHVISVTVEMAKLEDVKTCSQMICWVLLVTFYDDDDVEHEEREAYESKEWAMKRLEYFCDHMRLK